MEWESIVNQHGGTKTAECRPHKKYLRKAIISNTVSIAFVLAELFKLVHPVLGDSGMVIALCVAWFNLGRAKESATK